MGSGLVDHKRLNIFAGCRVCSGLGAPGISERIGVAGISRHMFLLSIAYLASLCRALVVVVQNLDRNPSCSIHSLPSCSLVAHSFGYGL